MLLSRCSSIRVEVRGGTSRTGGGYKMTSAEAEVRNDQFHVIHKVPASDTPVEKDIEGSIVWFWKAINAGDRVDSALKDMAVVMKQWDRAEEGIEAIKQRDRAGWAV
ncbi:hypothetical protein Taro_027680 [Colocasia esculenta]|uniref:Uncharacterized protein n=1 Tax=Colocasia esculenta TaxID=4460 RepID=A0A843VIS0_COLES|nr:hypothetical protein [Colocasia esculenta]